MPTASVNSNGQLQSNSLSVTQGTLDALLEEQYFLHKVLVHVTDDGLHECRRVCRLWREVCSTLPVSIQRTRPAEVSTVIREFPRATSLDVGRPASYTDVTVTRALPLLSELPKLRHLHLYLQLDRATPATLPTCFESMHCLRHLSVEIEDEMTYHIAMDAIRNLKQLERLHVDVITAIRLDPHPITELRGLRSLSAPFTVLVGRKGKLLFPFLTQLTGLKSTGNTLKGLSSMPELQALVSYASSLQSLEISTSHDLPVRPMDSGWNAFSSLTCLRFNRDGRNDASLVHGLWKMHLLAELDICISTQENAKIFSDSMSLLTGLASLSLKYPWEYCDLSWMTENVSLLTQLTRLSLKGALPCVRSLHVLTEMVDLDVRSQCDLMTDLLEALVRMPSLTSLKIVSRFESPAFSTRDATPFCLFGRLTTLKALVLRRVSLDRACLEALGHLLELTELRFDKIEFQEDLRRFYPRLSLLSNLRVLEAPHSWPFFDPRLGLLEGCMPRLREIRFRKGQLNTIERAALLRAFPCLRRLPPS